MIYLKKIYATYNWKKIADDFQTFFNKEIANIHESENSIYVKVWLNAKAIYQHHNFYWSVGRIKNIDLEMNNNAGIFLQIETEFQNQFRLDIIRLDKVNPSQNGNYSSEYFDFKIENENIAIDLIDYRFCVE